MKDEVYSYSEVAFLESYLRDHKGITTPFDL